MSIQATARPSLPLAIGADPHIRPRFRSAERWRLLTFMLVAVDALALAAAFGLAYLIRFKTGIPLLATPAHTVAFYSSVAFWTVPAWLGLFAIYRLYDRRRLFAGCQEYGAIFNACTAGLIIVMVTSFLYATLFISRGWLLLTWGLAIALVGYARFGMRRVLRALRSRGWFVVPTIIIGANEEGKALAEQFLENRGAGTLVLGFVDPACPPGTQVIGELQVLGDLTNLDELVRRLGVREIVIAPTAVARDELLDLYRVFGHDESVELRLSSGLFEVLTTAVTVQESDGVPLMTPHRVRITGTDALLKAVVDYVLALTALVILAPALLLIAALVKLDSPGPVLYRRRVLGRTGKPFDAFKFRTMVVNAERRQANVPVPFADRRRPSNQKTDARITRLGRLLRRTSLDELPQLINVLRGEMSLVGPRMIAPDEASLYGKWQLNLATVKPGITGPWQVRGRSELAYEDRVRLSMQYIRNYSIWLDVDILIRTILVVVQGKGAY
jgi:exopolysaccharide biosynthesis polyprenyl glycosylphosphotransferase